MAVAVETESWREWAAGIMATAVFTVAAWWKGRREIRRDVREDQTEQIAHDVHRRTIDRLESEVTRLARQMEAMSIRLDTETRLRYEAQAQAAELRLRVGVLEAELAELRGAPP